MTTSGARQPSERPAASPSSPAQPTAAQPGDAAQATPPIEVATVVADPPGVALERLHAVIQEVARTHSAALLAQRRRLVTTDVYGNELRDEWLREIEYFRTMNVKPAVFKATSRREVALALHRLSLQKTPRTRRAVQAQIARGNRAAELVLDSAIDTTLAEAIERWLVEEASEGGTDVSTRPPESGSGHAARD